MKNIIISLVSFWAIISVSFFAQANEKQNNEPATNYLIERPLIERYILDELKDLRQNQQLLRTETIEKMAQTQLTVSDRAIGYTADTTNNIFYIITATASLLVILGWKSLNDIKNEIEQITTEKVTKLIDNYEQRLDEVERKVTLRSEQLLAAQEEIANTNKLHSLWMRSGIERNVEEKIGLYDEILEMQPDDVEAMTYKADALLDIGESKWALSLTNQAIEQEKEYSFAFWQRACANADLGNHDEAIEDIKRSIELSAAVVNDLHGEPFFESLCEDNRFKELCSNIQS